MDSIFGILVFFLYVLFLPSNEKKKWDSKIYKGGNVW